MRESYRNFDAFYPDYLGEHSHRVCRRLHIVGTSLALLLSAGGLLTATWWLLPVAIVQGYAFSWVGHFVFEKNRPATFRHPWLSYRGDLRMLRETLSGKLPF